MSRADDLLASVLSGGAEAVERFISDRQSEELFLDFKRSADNGAGAKLHVTDRTNLAKAISGFANSEGGIIVWGVDCRNLPASGDVAQALVPLSDAVRFRSWLEGAISGCTIPPHPTVSHHAISSGGPGFVVTHVPKSYRGPHQAVPALQYYVRAGSDFVPAPHSVVMALAGFRPDPVLTHRWRVMRPDARPVMGEITELGLGVRLILSSLGPGLARDIFANGRFDEPSDRSAVNYNLRQPGDWEVRGQDTVVHLVSKEGFRLAPEAELPAFDAYLTLRAPFSKALSWEVSLGHGSAGIIREANSVDLQSLMFIWETVKQQRGNIDARKLYSILLGHDRFEIA